MRDRGRERLKRPVLTADTCTGCGACWAACPDSALTVRVNPAAEIFDAAAAGGGSGRLPRILRAAEALFEAEAKGDTNSFSKIASKALVDASRNFGLRPEEQQALKPELDELLTKIESHTAVITDPFYRNEERAGVLSIAVNPERCTGCHSCVAACKEDALIVPTSPSEISDSERNAWAFTAFLPSPDSRFLPNGNAGPNPASRLLDPAASESAIGGGEGVPGSSKRLAIRLFAATGSGTLLPRFTEHAKTIDALAEALEEKMRLSLSVGIKDPEVLREALKSGAATRSEITDLLDKEGTSVDPARLSRDADALATLRTQRDTLNAAVDRRAALLGAAFDSNLDSLRYPYAPYAFPCAWVGKGNGPELALGLFEAHMRKVSNWVKAQRIAALEIDDKYRPAVHDPFFAQFSWKDFTPEELALTPPVVIIGNGEDLFGRALGALSDLLDSGAPVKILALDAPTAPVRTALISLAHRDVFVLHGGFGNGDQLLDGLSSGFASPHPAIFHLVCPNEPEHGLSDAAVPRAFEALNSRLKPYFCYDPEAGDAPDTRLSMKFNPALEEDWNIRTVSEIEEDGSRSEFETAVTPADYLATDADWKDEFKKISRRSWSAQMVPVAEYLELDADEREESTPYIWIDGRTDSLDRMVVSKRIIDICEERLVFWRLLKKIVRNDIIWPDTDAIAEKARNETVETVAISLAKLAGEGAEALVREDRL